MVTELDVTDRSSPSDIATGDEEVARLYGRYLDVVLDNRAAIAVIIWGLTDRESWITRGDLKDFLRSDGLQARPLPFDEQHRPKKPYEAILRVLRAAPNRRRLLRQGCALIEKAAKVCSGCCGHGAGSATSSSTLHARPSIYLCRGPDSPLPWRFIRLLALRPHMSGHPPRDPAQSSLIQARAGGYNIRCTFFILRCRRVRSLRCT